ncbi:alpha/beta fold hydrolase family protein [Geomesophilobacter sediminis]|uniref:Alpha/beta fold hydrolase n=1 Tax=Geomesophilobacter sediminis TaxID=2798584 RepID=A0A8J7JLN4_9BACT|nr:alpha/beta fold hydrolase [Geomesophilobacter sediminis]MBJ6725090.1 alpha/beta fold hydrolase [Geomesophilobacter sediminis]
MRKSGSRIKSWCGLLLGAFLLLPAGARGEESGYGYPIGDAYAASILGTPKPLRVKVAGEVPLQNRLLETDPKKPEIFFYDRGLRYTVAFQDHKAPLVFLIAGTGSSSKTAKMVALMENLYRAGFHVIGLPSPTFPNFIIDASTTHVPGLLPEDAADLYRVMEQIWKQCQGRIEVSDFLLAGYSLGGTEAAFVAKLDDERKLFNFRRVLMLNPAVSLYRSVSRIEVLLDRIPGGARRIGAFYNRVIAKATDFYRKGDFVAIDDDFLYAAYQAHLMDRDESGGAIAVSFRISCAGMIFVSDVMTRGGYVVPANRVLKNSDSLSDYFWASLHLSFLDYFNEYFVPYFQNRDPGLTREDLIEALSIQSIESYLATSGKVGVITNEDDFILAPDEVDYLRRVFGPRLKVYPCGGHLGNMEYRDNMAFLIDRLRSSTW